MEILASLKQQQIFGDIENVLDTYPYHPYQKIFSVPELRQELITYVLTRIPHFQKVFEPQQVLQLSYKNSRQPLEQKIHLENLIHQGIYYVMRDKSDWINLHLCETMQSSYEPSHWFG